VPWHAICLQRCTRSFVFSCNLPFKQINISIQIEADSLEVIAVESNHEVSNTWLCFSAQQIASPQHFATSVVIV
jgi:hypothetical protein